MRSSSSTGPWMFVLLAVLAAGLLASSISVRGAAAQEVPPPGVLYGKKIVLDAGHGGSDAGASNAKYGLVEKHQTLDVANRLKPLLEASGATVYMTRTGDQTLSNNDRYSYANATGASILVSVHMNGSSNPATDYTTTLFGKWQKDKAFAQTVFKGLSTLPAVSGTGTIATKAPYSYASGVLLKSNMPATMAETVFITSDAEANLLKNGGGTRQQQIAEALEAGVKGYFGAL